jgi:hypothetical protein
MLVAGTISAKGLKCDKFRSLTPLKRSYLLLYSLKAMSSHITI